MVISIALATFNGARYIQDQLDSFLNQTLLPDELVISDDCSTDATLDIVTHFAKHAPFRVTWARNEKRLGYTANFNAALSHTSGDLVFLSDQDDVWFPSKITTIMQLAAQDADSLVFMNDAELTDATLRSCKLTKRSQIQAAGLGDSSFVMGCCAAIRRELLDLCLPVPESFTGHDSWIIGIAAGLGRKRVVPDILQYYRRHGDNVSVWEVNDTVRIRRWQLTSRKWLKALRRIARQRAISTTHPPAEVAPENELLRWACESVGRSPTPFKQDLERFILALEAQVLAGDHRRLVQHQRNAIRRKQLTDRIVAAYHLWREGEYRQFSGVTSAIRDVIGMP